MSTEEVIKSIVTRITRKDLSRITPETTFKDLQADSLDIVQILVALEDEFGIEIPDEELEDLANLGEFIAYIGRKVAEKG